MRTIVIDKSRFYADYFWSIHDKSEIAEDVFVKEYLSKFFTFKDLYELCKISGKERLIEYAKEVGNQHRIQHLLSLMPEK